MAPIDSWHVGLPNSMYRWMRGSTGEALYNGINFSGNHLSNEASRLGIGSHPTDGGEPLRACKLQDTLTVRVKHGAIHHHERPDPAAGDRAESLVEGPRIAHLDALQPHPEGLGLRRDVPWHPVVGPVSRMDEDGHVRERRHSFLQQL